MRNKHWVGVGASIFLGVVFTVSGLGKLFYQTETVEFFVFSEYLPAALSKTVYLWLPRLELLVGLLLISGVAARLVTTVASVLIAGFIASNGWLMSQGLGEEPCGCFGMAERIAQLKITTMGALYLDVVMMAFAVVVLVCYQSNFFELSPWFLRRAKNG